MKKLKLFIVLALLPAVLIGCGSSGSGKKDEKTVVKAKVAQAQQIGEVIDAQLEKNPDLAKASDEDLQSLKVNLTEYIKLVTDVLVDSTASGASAEELEEATGILAVAHKKLTEVNAEIEKRAKAKAA